VDVDVDVDVDVVVMVIVVVVMGKAILVVAIGTSVDASPLPITETCGGAKSDTPKIVTLSVPSAAIASVRWSARPVATVDVSPALMLLT
jgi:hypothetical protein